MAPEPNIASARPSAHQPTYVETQHHTPLDPSGRGESGDPARMNAGHRNCLIEHSKPYQESENYKEDNKRNHFKTKELTSQR
jgi:hypothetical protein